MNFARIDVDNDTAVDEGFLVRGYKHLGDRGVAGDREERVVVEERVDEVRIEGATITPREAMTLSGAGSPMTLDLRSQMGDGVYAEVTFEEETPAIPVERV